MFPILAHRQHIAKELCNHELPVIIVVVCWWFSCQVDHEDFLSYKLMQLYFI